MHITFTTARFNLEKVLELFPEPTGITTDKNSVTVTYSFGNKFQDGKHLLWIGLVKRSFEGMLDGNLSWEQRFVPGNGREYTVGELYHKYCTYKSYPKWIWAKHRKDLMKVSVRYAIRLYENDLWHFEMVLGMMYVVNSKMSGRIAKYDDLVSKAKWVYAKVNLMVQRGELKRPTQEEIFKVRSDAGKLANIKSLATRKSKVDARREKVLELFNSGQTDRKVIADELNVNVRTVDRDLQSLDV